MHLRLDPKLRFAVGTGLAFGLVLTIVRGDASDPGRFITMVALRAALFATVVWLIAAFTEWRQGGRSFLERGGSSARGAIAVEAPPAQVFRRVLALADAVAGFHCVDEDRHNLTIQLRTSPSWSSLGEHLRVRVGRADGATQVEVRSRSRVPFTAYDFDKNRRNVDLILRHIEEGGFAVNELSSGGPARASRVTEPDRLHPALAVVGAVGVLLFWSPPSSMVRCGSKGLEPSWTSPGSLLTR